jgi:hypothetical protein
MILDHKNDGLFKYVLEKATKVIVLADSFKGIMKNTFDIQAEVLYNPIDYIDNIEKKDKDNYIQKQKHIQCFSIIITCSICSSMHKNNLSILYPITKQPRFCCKNRFL